MSVAAALRVELKALGELDSTLGAGALVLAERLDDPATNSSAVPAYQRELRETMAVLVARRSIGDTDRMTEFENKLAARRAATA